MATSSLPLDSFTFSDQEACTPLKSRIFRLATLAENYLSAKPKLSYLQPIDTSPSHLTYCRMDQVFKTSIDSDVWQKMVSYIGFVIKIENRVEEALHFLAHANTLDFERESLVYRLAN
jgi:hypothetical protein